MNLYFIATAAIALFAGWLVFRDLRTEESGILMYLIARRTNPIGYWLLVTMWTTIFVISVFLAWAFVFFPPGKCGDDGKCQVTVELRRA